VVGQVYAGHVGVLFIQLERGFLVDLTTYTMTKSLPAPGVRKCLTVREFIHM
jgi:hypothetical protein